MNFRTFSKMVAKVHCESSRQLGFALSYTLPSTLKRREQNSIYGNLECLFRLDQQSGGCLFSEECAAAIKCRDERLRSLLTLILTVETQQICSMLVFGSTIQYLLVREDFLECRVEFQFRIFVTHSLRSFYLTNRGNVSLLRNSGKEGVQTRINQSALTGATSVPQRMSECRSGQFCIFWKGM